MNTFLEVALTVTVLVALAFLAARWLRIRDAQRDIDNEELAQQRGFRQFTATNLQAINNATQQLVRQREPTLEEVRAFVEKRGFKVCSEAEMLHHLSQAGFVIITAERWAQMLEQLGQQGMSVDRWINREE